jgi:signal-transduction protein with cAMP-binding, CBS, and nucleotidyltransferase domain
MKNEIEIFKMIAKEIASNDILPLKTSDSCLFALSVMEENRVHHLPVVNDRDLLGLVAEFDLINHPELEDPVGNVRLTLPVMSIHEHEHLFDIMKMFTEMKLSLLPVVDQRNGYSGVITLPNLLRYITIHTSILNPGGIIVLEASFNNYSFLEIAQIIESNDARILCAFITSRPDSTLIDITLKINLVDIGPIIQTFERYHYTIKATFAEKDDLDDLKERYDALMNYLNI